jgi:hypothetical protein
MKSENMIKTIFKKTKILGFIVFSLTFVMNANSQTRLPIEVRLNIQKLIFTKKIVTATVIIKNISDSTVVIPKIDKDYPSQYISFEIIHQLTNTSVGFLGVKMFSEISTNIAPSTKILRPNDEESFKLLINETKAGFWGATRPNDPLSVQKFFGRFSIRARFVVDENNLPTTGNILNVFRGTVYSAPIVVNVK